VTIDEELNLLDSNLRRLKIEYEIYFSNPSKRAPADIEWKVLNLLRKFSDGGRMSFSQRYRYNEMAQRYAIYSDLWRKKLKIKEEGYSRPQDAMLSIQGIRTAEEHAAAAALQLAANKAFSVVCYDLEADSKNVEALFQAMMEAKKKTGETSSANFDSFKTFVKKKTEQIRQDYNCKAVEYSVELENGQVRLKAKAKS